MGAGESFVARFEERAKLFPDHIAVRSAGEVLSYRALREMSDALANDLNDRGVDSGDVVGVCLDRTPRLLVAILGIAKAGCAFVLIDPELPESRVGFVLQVAGPTLVITQESYISFFDRRSEYVLFHRLLEPVRASNLRPFQAGIKRNDIAYLVFTSGSTGVPKAVAIEHGGLSDLLAWALVTFKDSLSIVLASSPLSFDMCLFELLAPLCAGGTVNLSDSVFALYDDNPNQRPTMISTVPVALEELVHSNSIPDSVECIIVAGDILTEAVASSVFDKSKVYELWNLYGLSEDTIYSTAQLLTPDRSERVKIGTPLPERELLLLDEELQPIEPGEIGEIYVGGVGLSAGYFGDARLTAERFLPHPSPRTPGERIYRTGDLGRQSSDGSYEFLGRIDDQIKIFGRRVEPVEIETTIESVTGARAVVFAQKGGSGHQHLVAQVVTSDRDFCPRDFRRKIAGSLPSWMVPSVIETVECLPLTPNGKVDRSALAPFGSRRVPSDRSELFNIVANRKDQMSLWFASRRPPIGWQVIDGPFTKLACLSRIDSLPSSMKPQQASASRTADVYINE